MSHRFPKQVGETNGEAKNTESKVNDVKDVEIKKEYVKMERLSPTTTSTTITTTSTSGNSNPHTDNNSNSSRSGTPSSSYPGTPPGAISDLRDHGSSPSNPSAHISGSHLKQMEQMMMSRNYSDFMRSLAAKYNNANPNE